jgi:hypothetical protein
MRFFGRSMVVAVVVCLSLIPSPSEASIISIPLGSPAPGANPFNGTFTADNDVALISFALNTTTLVTADVTSQFQTPAGFDPVLTLFGPGTDFMGGFDFMFDDTTGSIASLLGPGSYLLAITQYSNFYVPFQNRFDFDAAVNGAFTQALFDPTGSLPCSSFVAFDFNTLTPQCRTGSFDGTLNIPSAPEPAALALLALGAAAGVIRRRRSRSERDTA